MSYQPRSGTSTKRAGFDSIFQTCVRVPSSNPPSSPVRSRYSLFASNMGQQASRIVELENGSDIYLGGLQAVNEVVLDFEVSNAILTCVQVS